jgi:hypothetical protein
MKSKKTTVEILLGANTKVFVEGTYTPAYPGCMYRRNGDPGVSPEPEQFEIDTVRDEKGNDITALIDYFAELHNQKMSQAQTITGHKYIYGILDVWETLEELVLQQTSYKEEY